jgi:hypothetical protein
MAAAAGAIALADDAGEDLGACASCERGGRWLAHNALGLTDSRRMPS